MNKKVVAVVAAVFMACGGLGLLLITLPLLAVVGAGGGGGSGCGPAPGAVAGVAAVTAPQDLPAAQRSHAATIISVGQSMGIPPQGILVELAASGAETRYRNLANDGSDPRILPSQRDVGQSLVFPNDGVGHDHASVGILQQQVVFWGTVAELMNPTVAARKFYERLLTVRGWETMPVTVAAQSVQGSATPDAYAAWESTARQLYGELAGKAGTPGAPAAADVAAVACIPGAGVGPVGVVADGVKVTLPAQSGFTGALTFPTQAAATAAAAGLSQLGVRYSWGGGGPSGPTNGIRDGGVGDSFGDYNHPGFDCSGLTEFAYARAGIFIGGDTNTQFARIHQHVTWAQALPGDLMFYGPASNTHHVAMYLGADATGRQLMLEAPQSGLTVRVSLARTGGDFLAGDVARPSTGSTSLLASQ